MFFPRILCPKFEISGRLVFRASAETVLRDPKWICSCKMDCGFQKSDAKNAHVLRASSETRAFLRLTSQASHITQSHTTKTPPNQTIITLTKTTTINQTTHITDRSINQPTAQLTKISFLCFFISFLYMQLKTMNVHQNAQL